MLYTNNGTDTPPAVLGTLSIVPAAISYFDGILLFPDSGAGARDAGRGKGGRRPSRKARSSRPNGVFDVSKVEPDVRREMVISGGFLNDLASKSDPKSFVYAFDGTAFPNVPLIQPRLDSVEEWTFVNNNNDEHPIHVHVNDFQVRLCRSDDRAQDRRGNVGGRQCQCAGADPGSQESRHRAGALSMRTRFEDYTGIFVMHCHRLNHEDNGLMALINVIPALDLRGGGAGLARDRRRGQGLRCCRRPARPR